MIGIRIFNLCSQKSTVITRNVFALSCRKSPKFFLSSLYPKFSASSTVVPQGMCIHSSRRFASDQASKQPKKQEGTGVSNTVDTPPHHPHTNTILQRLHDLEESFRVRGHSVLRWGLSALIVAGIIIYIFREPLRENVADEVADVASRSLADENVILKANEVTRAVLQDVLCDPEITKLASAFVMHVLHRDDVRAAAIQLTQHVLSDPSTLRKIVELAKTALSDLTAHEETRKLMLSYVKALILDQNTKDACKILLEELVNDPDVKGFMAASLGDLVTSSVVKSSAAELGKSVTHQVVNDVEIQQETGNFLWRALKKTFTPGWFG